MTDERKIFTSLQERTLKVLNLSEKVTKDLLYELFLQCGPVHNVFLKPEFSYIEFEHKDSVGYALALMDGIQLYGKTLKLQPRISDNPETYFYLNQMRQFEATFSRNPINWWHQFGDKTLPLPSHICSQALASLPTPCGEPERTHHSRNESPNRQYSRGPNEDYSYPNAQYSNYDSNPSTNQRYHSHHQSHPHLSHLPYHSQDDRRPSSHMHEPYFRRLEPNYYNSRVDYDESSSRRESSYESYKRADQGHSHYSRNRYNRHSHHKSGPRHSNNHYDNRTYSHDRSHSRY